MNEKHQSQLITHLLEATLNRIGFTNEADAAAFLLMVVHHAAHLAKAMTDAELVADILAKLAAHLPECTHNIGYALHTAPPTATKH